MAVRAARPGTWRWAGGHGGTGGCRKARFPQLNSAVKRWIVQLAASLINADFKPSRLVFAGIDFWNPFMVILRKDVAPWEQEDELDTCPSELGTRLALPSGDCDAVGDAPDGTDGSARDETAATVSGCFSLMLPGLLIRSGHVPTRLDTCGEVDLCIKGKPRMSRVLLKLTAKVPGIAAATFDRLAINATDMVTP